MGRLDIGCLVMGRLDIGCLVMGRLYTVRNRDQQTIYLHCPLQRSDNLYTVRDRDQTISTLSGTEIRLSLHCPGQKSDNICTARNTASTALSGTEISKNLCAVLDSEHQCRESIGVQTIGNFWNQR